MVGYFGADPGDPVIVPAGSIVVLLEHRLSPQRAQHDRPRAARLRRPVLRRAAAQRGRLTPAPPRRTAARERPSGAGPELTQRANFSVTMSLAVPRSAP